MSFIEVAHDLGQEHALNLELLVPTAPHILQVLQSWTRSLVVDHRLKLVERRCSALNDHIRPEKLLAALQP